MGQEPGAEAEIHPFYKYLTESSGQPGPISWNFNKFLVAPDGKVAARWGSRTAPDAKELTAKVEELLS